jgi:nucleotide-binding universal stress UspA family protein
VRQAIALAGGAELHFVAVSPTRRVPRHSQGQLRKRLEEIARLALDAGVSVSARLVSARRAIDVLLPESEHHDLLVLGSRHRSRRSGIALDSTASRAAHETRGPLLIAREPPGEARFPEDILVALEGSPGSWAPARAAAAIAACFDSRLEVVHVAEGADPGRSRALEAQIAEVGRIVGRAPAITEAGGHPTHAIVESAREKGPSLVVCGRRGLHGIRALGSVSERVVHRAPCSVLVGPGSYGAADP